MMRVLLQSAALRLIVAEKFHARIDDVAQNKTVEIRVGQTYHIIFRNTTKILMIIAKYFIFAL